jgi:murein peptide amidase A
MKAASTYLLRHRCHDVPWILQRWRRVAKAAQLRLQVLAMSPAGYPVYLAKTKHQAAGGIYVSVGVHGDEPAPVAALLEWAEENVTTLRSANAILMPLFNPGGLALNTRADERGVDLNRQFHDTQHPVIGSWHRAMEGSRFQIGCMVHEDYDGQGIYAYELTGKNGPFVAPALDSALPYLPRDERKRIDGFKAQAGIIQRRRKPSNLPGLPEALVVWRHFAPTTFTLEAPSEFSLEDRVRGLKGALDYLFETFGGSK